MIELSVCGGDAALCQITLTTCFFGDSWTSRLAALEAWRPGFIESPNPAPVANRVVESESHKK